MAGWLVASDVDHTLLEQPDEAALAGECLRRLQQRGIGTLLASSKTFSEMVALQDGAALAPQPFLFENGAGIGWPLGSWPPQAMTPPRLRRGAYGALVGAADPQRLTTLLGELRAQLGLRYSLLGELSTAEVEQQLGLTKPLARLALQRLASQPLIWRDGEEELKQLRQQLAGHGLTAVWGGRLLHIAPPGGKGEALERLVPWLATIGLANPLSVLACGDGENDRSLLEMAAIALVFHAPDRQPMTLAVPYPGRCLLRRSVPAGGPQRWLEAVEAALEQIGPVPQRQ